MKEDEARELRRLEQQAKTRKMMLANVEQDLQGNPASEYRFMRYSLFYAGCRSGVHEPRLL
jgi:hypothetical protein